MFDGAIIAARFVQFGFALVLFGASLFCVYGVRAETTRIGGGYWNWPRLALSLGATGALLGTAWWVTLQTALFFPEAGALDRDALGVLLGETQFGQACLVRFGLLLISIALTLAAPATANIGIAQSVLGAGVLASFAWTGHGASDVGWPGAIHTGADILHLLAAGLWIGALSVLCHLLLQSRHKRSEADARIVLYGLERFSGIGPALVSVLVLTGLINSWFLLGAASWSALLASFYGFALAAKLLLFGGMLALAAANRYRLGPLLKADLERNGFPAAALARLRASLLTETALALLVVMAVAALGTFEPPYIENS